MLSIILPVSPKPVIFTMHVRIQLLGWKPHTSSVVLLSFRQANRRCGCEIHMYICMRSHTWVADSKLLKRSVGTRNCPALEWATYCDIWRNASARGATATVPHYDSLFGQLTGKQVRNVQCSVGETFWKAFIRKPEAPTWVAGSKLSRRSIGTHNCRCSSGPHALTSKEMLGMSL
jgi:hypothetical protein